MRVHEPVRKELLIGATAERAFRAFTDEMGQWWPRTHHIGKAELSDVVVEPRAGGRWYEIGVDGSQCNWGKVLIWDPPRRLVLAWQITAAWSYDPDFLTEVEIQFIAEEPRQTRLKLEHRNIERFGVKAQELWSAFDSQGGWTGIISAFAALAEGSGART
jgi:uncharacterized protein YndB with AHSA1/START domain